MCGSSETNLWLHNLKIKLIRLLNHKALGQNVDYSRAERLKDLLWVQTLEWITNSLPSTTGGCEDVNGGSSACLTTPTALQIKSADNGVALTSENGTVLTFLSFPGCSSPTTVGNASASYSSASIFHVHSSKLEHVNQLYLIYLIDPPMTPGYRPARAKHSSFTKTRLIAF